MEACIFFLPTLTCQKEREKALENRSLKVIEESEEIRFSVITFLEVALRAIRFLSTSYQMLIV